MSAVERYRSLLVTQQPWERLRTVVARSGADVVGVAVDFAAALDDVGVPYFVTGSFATSLYGEPRAATDLDFVADLQELDVMLLVERLGEAYAFDAEQLRRAVRTREPAHLLHTASRLVIDLYLVGEDPHGAVEVSRRQAVRVTDLGAFVMVISPEDAILRCLREGHTVQAVHMLRLGRPSLDQTYLELWSRLLGVHDRLIVARASAAT